MKTAYQNIIKPTIQLKSDLQIGQPDDQYEQEADQVAAQVMRKASDSEPIMRKCEDCEKEDIQRKPEQSMIQRDEDPVATVTKDATPSNTAAPSPAGSGPPSPSFRTNRCFTNPEYPNFPCLLAALKLDVDENLWNNAHHFYRTASLYPGRNDLMLDTFMRYGVGLNNLETIYGFMGADETTSTVLSYLTGIGLKAYTFTDSGELTLDIPWEITDGLNLEFNLDLNANPDNLFNTREWDVNAGVGLTGHFW